MYRAVPFYAMAWQAAQRKMLDVLNSVGLGDTLLRLIEHRQRMDIWFAYGGMVSNFASQGGKAGFRHMGQGWFYLRGQG